MSTEDNTREEPEPTPTPTPTPKSDASSVSHPAAGRRLSARQAEELAERLAELTEAGVPLSGGLRAAAAESPHSALNPALLQMAQRLEAGQPLQDLLTERQLRLPEHIQGLIEAGIRTGRLAQVLIDMVYWKRTTSDLWQQTRAALAYPLILVLLATAIFGFVAGVVVPGFRGIYEDFDTQLPRMTETLLWFSEHGAAILCCYLLIVVALAVVVRLAAGRQQWRRLLLTVPMLGPLLQWHGVAQFARLLCILLDQRVPLPEALRLTAAGTRDPCIAAAARRLSAASHQGQPLAGLLAAEPVMPASLVPIVRWGEQTGALGEAFATAAEMFEGRIQLRTALLTTILPPIAFVTIGAFTLAVVFSLFLPLVGLVQNLA